MTDTRPPTLPGDDGSAGSDGGPAGAPPGSAQPVRLASTRHRWWTVPVVIVTALVLVGIPVASIVPAGWVASEPDPRTGQDRPTPFARTPASAQPVSDRIVFGELGAEADQYPPQGDFYFVTITEPSQSALSWLLGRNEPAVEFLTDEQKFGVQTPQQRRTFALEFMRTSEQVAQFVALQRVGFDVQVVPGDVLIEAMVCLEATADNSECATWSPSDDVLDPGDTIVEVDGQTVDGVEDLARIVDGFEPGDTVTMIIERPGDGGAEDTVEVDVELTAAPDDPDRTIVGFYPFDTRRVELPFELDIDTGSIGGPSAGLAFTLTLIDELTPGELSGGGRVAVTGTIELDGSVGAIGGLRQKASAVAQSGVEVFLVPASQRDDDLAEARSIVGDAVDIIPVSNLDEALAALVEIGGDPIPPAPDPATASG